MKYSIAGNVSGISVKRYVVLFVGCCVVLLAELVSVLIWSLLCLKCDAWWSLCDSCVIHKTPNVTGGGEGADDECAEDVTPCEGGATVTKDMIFPKVPWNFDAADMTAIIEMKNRTRLTKFAKELLNLPCMASGADIAGSEAEICERRVNEIARRSCYGDLCQAGTQFLVSLRDKQCERLEVKSAEENVERQPALSCQVYFVIFN